MIKLWEENLSEKPLCLWGEQSFFNMMQKEWSIKIKLIHWASSQLTTSALQKITLREQKASQRMKYLQSIYLIKDVSRIYKEPSTLNNKKTTQFKTGKQI